MTTAEVLEAITDRAMFELLSTSVLRRANDDYASIIHTGINSKGETIVAPIDGLHLIPRSDSPHYVFVQHTTTDRRKLRDKWLSNKDSDLNKSIEVAETIRQEVPNSVFTVVLSTNQRVDVDLARDVMIKAGKHGLSLDLWTQDRFADFLDHDKDGQWLRKMYLGIEAERISQQLLLELCRTSLDEYNRHVSIDTSTKQVRRSETDNITKTASRSETLLLLVAGDSGVGKSTLVAHAMRELLRDGSLAIWLPPRFLQSGIPFYAALGNWLRELAPNIEVNAGREALFIAANSGGIFVCVDDINRSYDPVSLLRNITSLVTPRSSAGDGNHCPALHATIVVPIWPTLLQYLEKYRDQEAWLRVIPVGLFRSLESIEIITTSAPQLTPLEANEFADRLSNDPFLVGNFSSFIDSSAPRSELVLVCNDVVGYAVSQMERRVADSSKGQFLAPELHSSLIRFGAAMLKHFCLTPTWKQIEQWFADSQSDVRAIRHVLHDNHVCRLESDETIVFRHDRFRDHILSESTLTVLNENKKEVTFEPFFAKTFGQAIAANTDCAVFLESLRIANPLALFEALRFIGEPSKTYHHRIVREIERWCIDTSEHLVDSLVDAISFSLLETDSSAVAPLVEKLPINHVTLLAGFRNGDLKCGIRFFKSFVNHSFEPSFRNSIRDRIVEHVRGRFLAEVKEQIADLDFEDLSDEDAAGLLTLIGHVSPVGMDPAISRLWMKDTTTLLPYAIWAACRCPLTAPALLLGPMFKRLQSLSVRTDYTKARTYRDNIVHHLASAFSRGINDEAIQFILAQDFENGKFRQSIARLIYRVDQPDAVEFLVRELGKGFRSTRLGLRLDGIGDNPPRREPYSAVSADRLRSIWSSTREEAKVRTKAFCLWLIIAPNVSVEELRNILPTEPFADYSLQFRVLSHDFTATHALLSKIHDREWWWWSLAHHIWDESLEAELDKQLAEMITLEPSDSSDSSSGIESFLERVLVMIPPRNAETLLVKHWGHLKFRKEMFAPALRIGTSTCVNLAKEIISQVPQAGDLFDHIFMDWHRAHQSNPITIALLNELLQFSNTLTSKHWGQLFMAIEWSKEESVELVEWMRENIIPLIPKTERYTSRYSDEYVIKWLNSNLDPQRRVHVYRLFDNRCSDPNLAPRVLRVVHDWFKSNRTQRGYEIFAACLTIAGTRADLQSLDVVIEGVPEEIERIRQNAIFAVRRRTLK